MRLYHRLILFFILIASLPLCADSIESVGLKRLNVVDPVSLGQIDTVVFYPSSAKARGMAQIGPYDVEASQNSSIASNRFPLVIISHGNSGSMWSHHDTASFLAKHGYIVVSLTHPRDNFKDASGLGASSTIYGRPLQVSAVISAVLSDSFLSEHINDKKIGFIGFSAGGGTGLFLSGAELDPQRFKAYCKNYLGTNVCEGRGEVLTNRGDILPKPDKRISAFVLMAPLSAPFSPESLKNIRVPILIFSGQEDQELSVKQNAVYLSQTLQSPVIFKQFPKAGHFIFLSPCSDALTQSMPILCNDAVDVNRVKIHQTMNMDIVEFFNKQLNDNTKLD